MYTQIQITNLNDLFYALFRGEDGAEPVIKGQPRLVREEYFQLFFPEALVKEYLGKTKSNLTWFFNDDKKNKAIKRTLIRMLDEDTQSIVDGTCRKCREILWPEGQQAAFDQKQLWDVFSRIYLPSNLNARLYITEQAGPRPNENCRMKVYYDADPAAAMGRLLMTISVASDAPEPLIRRIWDSSRAGDGIADKDTSVSGRIRRGKLLYLSGRHKEAYEAFASAAKQLSRPAQTLEESELYTRMGTMLITGDGHYRDQAEAVKYLKLGCWDGNPESYYLYAKQASDADAKTAMARAAELGCVRAARELGNKWYYNERNADKAKVFYQQGLTENSEDGAYCAYMLGRIYEAEGDHTAAIRSYQIAQERGSSEAALRLSELNHGAETRVPSAARQALDAAGGYCVSNELTGINPVFCSSLTESWKRTVLSKGQDIAAVLDQLAPEIFAPAQVSFPRLILCLMSENRESNLHAAVTAIQSLDRLVSKLGSRKQEAVRAVQIYVAAEHDYASLILDAAMAGCKGTAFPLRLCDPACDSADELFSAAPLFLPCLTHAETEEIRLVVLGTTETALRVVQRALALPLPKPCRVTVTVLGEDAEEMERRFYERCPGLMGAGAALCGQRVTFRPCRLRSGEIFSHLWEVKKRRLDQKEVPAEDLGEVLGQGNYYVVAMGEDSDNIRLAVQLRAELLKLDPTFSNLPFIAVRVRDPLVSWLAGNITAGTRSGASGWHSQYGLFCFGSNYQYTCLNLQGDLIEKRAQALHRLYSGSGQGDPMVSYYRRQYNRDSSRATALYCTYHLFAAGIQLPDWKMYSIPDELEKLAPRYQAYLEADGNLERAAQLEHERWNCFMLTNGWERATVPQVETYVQRGNPGHQLYIGKLHPFLCSWEELASGVLLQRVTEAVHSRLPEVRIADPRTADAESVKDVAALLKVR